VLGRASPTDVTTLVTRRGEVSVDLLHGHLAVLAGPRDEVARVLNAEIVISRVVVPRVTVVAALLAVVATRCALPNWSLVGIV
jgi:hypothetical protein